MTVRQCFFRLQGDPAPVDLPVGLELERFSPSLGRLRAYSGEASPPLALHLFWYVGSARKYAIYYVRHQGEVVHVSHVLGRSYKFPFMKKQDLHIGPCWTADQFRGHGIYPAVLSRIALDHPGTRLWMLTDEANAASRRGIEKAGFRAVGSGVKEKGVYRLTSSRGQDR